MSPLVSNIVFLSVLTGLLIPAKKWAEMNPHRIEDGPSWVKATVSALYSDRRVLFEGLRTPAAQATEPGME
ncbi:hypothetical protein FBZ93_111238 [Bradyrhizobium macuxiense]|uniref:Uncharacterized protein n=1 Tax=Bradyrhizobium macuxiense TaxID=1755647 RepID=A0A560LDC0_9BRAD|nr:hypothetical protein [Bradyrhizobium macuxiense]TWB93199.1 hypothetical protein FBZ93_111238 [Bradyrhizobium macuxiense]